jgi:glutamate dehydrogenase (NAD(P)+)
MDEVFALADDLGPLKVIHVHEPGCGLQGVLVVDNVARGPSIGGLRMATDVTTEECARLARAMTFKNAAADLPHGGGKSVLVGDPKMPREQKEILIRGFACALREVEQYIFGPDMGTDEECMAWVKDEIDRAVGLPRDSGGIPLDEIGATGFGLHHAIDVAQEFCDVDIGSARVAIQGFGAVGRHAARFLAEAGAVTVAVSDSKGTIYEPGGLDIERPSALKSEGGSVTEYDGGETRDRDAIIDIDCDIWIPAARPDVIHEGNARFYRQRRRRNLRRGRVPGRERGGRVCDHRGKTAPQHARGTGDRAAAADHAARRGTGDGAAQGRAGDGPPSLAYFLGRP